MGWMRPRSIAIEPVELATAQAAQVALQAGQVDMIVVDWLWVARQRGAGARLDLRSLSRTPWAP